MPYYNIKAQIGNSGTKLKAKYKSEDVRLARIDITEKRYGRKETLIICPLPKSGSQGTLFIDSAMEH